MQTLISCCNYHDIELTIHCPIILMLRAKLGSNKSKISKSLPIRPPRPVLGQGTTLTGRRGWSDSIRESTSF